MDRRDVLTLLGSGGILTGGLAGIYLAFRGWSPFDGPVEDPNPVEGEPVPGPDDDDEGIENGATREGDLLFGVAPQPPQDVFDPFEEWLGAQHAVVGVFVDMGATEEEIHEHVHGQFEAIWERGHVPHVYWQPFFPSQAETSNEINREIAAGEYDETLETWTEELTAWAGSGDDAERRIYLNLAPEFNGDWSPWSPALGDEDEEDFVAMWRHVHEIVADAGLGPEEVQWIWTLDNTTRGVDREACYPGDEYVDWAGIHGYNWANWGSWLPAEDVYGSTIATIRSITDKPIAITEFGSSSETEDGDHDPEKKDAWITDAYAYLRQEDVRMALWFNLVKETDWTVFGGEFGVESVRANDEEYTVYPAYRQAVTDDAALGSHPDYESPLTEDEFAGRFR